MARNTSDSIEEYIKELLGQSGTAEIQRSNLADAFQVVPSQINYVIKTRFTESRGYIVESKRGGGGYIRIVKTFHRSGRAWRTGIPVRHSRLF